MEYKTLWDLLRTSMEEYADRTAVRIKEHGEWRSYSYAELRELSTQLALAFIDLGIEQSAEVGDRVAVLTENRPEFVITDLALKQIGGVTAPAHKEYTAAEIGYHLNDSGAKAIVVATDDHLGKVLSLSEEQAPDLEHIIVTDFRNISRGVARKAAQDSRVLQLADLYRSRKSAETRDELERRQGRLSPEDITTFIYTSGTTSNPKGVMHTHGSLLFSVEKVLEVVKLPEPYIALNIIPLPHSFGYLADYLVPFSAGGEVIYSAKPEFIDNVKFWKPTTIAGAPKLFEKMQEGIRAKGGGILGKGIEWLIQRAMEEPESRWTKVAERIGSSATGGRLQYFVSGGAALDPRLFDWIGALGLEILQGYGMTEGVPFSVNPPGEGNLTGLGSAGKVLNGLDVIVEQAPDSEGSPRTSPTGGPVGELLFAGPLLMKGYWQKPELTAKTLVDIRGTTYMRTGDLGYVREIDGERHVFIVGRAKDEIVLNTGRNISPAEIEEVITRSPEVNQTLIHGSTRDYIGNDEGWDRDYITALIGVSEASLERVGKATGVSGTMGELLQDEGVLDYYRSVVAEQVKDLALYKRPKDIRLIPEITENDLWELQGKKVTPLTPTLKLKRPVVQTYYQELLDSMYD